MSNKKQIRLLDLKVKSHNLEGVKHQGSLEKLLSKIVKKCELNPPSEPLVVFADLASGHRVRLICDPNDHCPDCGGSHIKYRIVEGESMPQCPPCEEQNGTLVEVDA